jgi:predicted nucleic acid-binding protein
MNVLRVYFDNCAYNRPYDDQSNIRNRLEAEAKLHIQELIKAENIDLVWSSVNDFENNDNPSIEKQERIRSWKNIAVEYCRMNDEIRRNANELSQSHFGVKDALHIAAAVFSNCDYFITTDKKILNKSVSGTKIINPIHFVEVLYEK